MFSGYSFSTLAQFGVAELGHPRGKLAVDAEGNLYGATGDGGASGYGTLFEIAHGSGAATTLASFDGTNGSTPTTGVTMDSHGNLFGTTEAGGASGSGTVFELVQGSHFITALASFTGPFAPFAAAGAARPTTDAAGNLFGTTSAGGPDHDGTIFEVAHNSGTITTLASFNGTNGAYPTSGVVVDNDGNLFGTTGDGGSYGNGTVFELAHGSSTISALASFNSSTNGYDPEGVILDGGGNLYGATYTGGANDCGNIFEVARNSSAITVLASFNITNGANPLDLVRDGDGNLYGVTEWGGANNRGTLFELSRGAANLTTLATADSSADAGPGSSLILDSGGNLFGIMAAYTNTVPSRAFGLPRGSATINTVFTFPGAPSGIDPSNLVMDAAGNLFGTTADGGDSDNGTVFELAEGSQTIQPLASFSTYYDSSTTGLTLDRSGNLYGTMAYGGLYNDGAVFELARGSGAIAILASFNGENGRDPEGGLFLDGNGNLYGTARYGGTDGAGTVFELSRGSASITALTSFHDTDGSSPVSGVIQDSSGSLYGSTMLGGTADQGTLFELAQGSATVATRASLDYPTSGTSPGDVAVDSAGNVYGTAYWGGSGGQGTTFELDRQNASITTLASFGGGNGANPNGIVLDERGNLYGTTYRGGAGASGTVYEIRRGSRTMLTLCSFNGANGTGPAGLVVDSSGNLFGVTSGRGDPGEEGSIFELSPDGLPLHAGSLAITAAAAHLLNNVLVATFSDDDPAGTPGEYAASVEWGDGDSSANCQVIPDPNIAGQFDVLASKPHPYAQGGTQQVTVTIDDDGGSWAVAHSTANIAPRLNMTFYVDIAAPGPIHDGLSWATAYTNLQDALFVSVSGDRIQLADGTYVPTTGTDRTISFQLKSGVGLYGGYAGYGATNPDARDATGYPTILSGDIGSEGDSSDNSYHVVLCPAGGSAALIDGLTLTAANGLSQGGAVDNEGNLTIDNCAITGNVANDGGGIYNAGTLTLNGCKLTGNAAAYTTVGFSDTGTARGGAIYSLGEVKLNGCVLAGNSAKYASPNLISFSGSGGGGVFNAGSLTATDCNISGNSASIILEANVSTSVDGGGAIYNAGPITLNGCNLTGNSCNNLGGAMFNGTGSPAALTSCWLAGNSGQGGGIYGQFSLANCTVTANSGGGLIVVGTATIDHSAVNGNTGTGIVVGASSGGSALTMTDSTMSGNSGTGVISVASNANLQNCLISGNALGISNQSSLGRTGTMIMNRCTVSGNHAPLGGGGLINQAALTLNDCTISANSSPNAGGILNTGATAVLALNNCAVIGNSGRSGGGILQTLHARALLTGCTITANSASVSGGAIAVNSTAATLGMANSIVWGNSAPTDPEISAAANIAVTYSDVRRGYPGAANIDADPRFRRNPAPGPDGVWGTADDDYGDLQLGPGSPCIDAGDNAAVPATITTDLAGHRRVVDIPGVNDPGVNDPGAIVDMGAYELQFGGSGTTLQLHKKKFAGLSLGTFVDTAFTSPSDFSAVITWGDGTTSAGTIVIDPSGGRFEVLGTQKYKKKGSYNVQISITDAGGARLVLSSTITVGDKD
jgi:uncharacterized repeat protein (TIGR03803 family)